MSRGIRFSTVLTWFREGDEDEVRAILPLVIEAAGARHITIHAGPSTRPARAAAPKRNRSKSAHKAWVTRRLNAAKQTEQAVGVGA